MLYLIGMGLYDEKDISLRGYEALNNSETIFLDHYTHVVNEEAVKRLENTLGKKIIKLERVELEGEKTILDAAKDKTVSLIVGGDPLIATTHTSLLLSCIKAGIKYEIIHSSSIFSAAIGESGLQTYKFGKSVTLVFWEEKYKPTTTYDIIYENKKNGLHTLVFVDIHGQKAMDIKTACSTLRQMENEIKKGMITDNFEFLVLSRIGYPNKKIIYCALKNIEESDIKAPFIIIVPGKLHFTEKEWLDNFRI